MSKNNNLRHNWPRYVLQWGTLAAIIFFLCGLAKLIFPKMEPVDPEALCPLGGMEALTTFWVRGSLPCSMSSLQVMMGIALAAAVVLLSKLFCGYLCPVGTVQDLLLKLRNKLKIKAISIKQGTIADKALRIVKYVLVFWIFYMTATASELFCKHLDPYYAVATGFKGEITLWMSIVTVSLVTLGSFFIDMFWCKYLCPLGAISNSLKFWAWILGISLLWFVLGKVGLAIPWFWLLGALCLAGYLLEILCGKPRLQVMHIIKDDAKCTGCGLCNKACPYHIDIAGSRGKVTSVDCTLCGECTGSCNFGAIQTGLSRKAKGGAWKYVPAVLTLLLLGIGFWAGSSFELPTIDETWGVEKVDEDGTVTALVDKSTLKTFEIEPLRSVKCYGSSMAFKGKLQQIKGTHGVRTYVGKHRVAITYDPAVTSPEKIQEAIFVPSKFRVENPDHKAVEQVKMVTIRTENMPDKMDLNNLGMQLRFSEKKIYGIESEFACPLIIRVFMDPSESADEKWFRDIVEKKTLEMPTAGGDVKVTPLNFKFVELEKGEELIPVADYMHRMFTSFKAEFNGKYEDGIKKRTEVYEGQPQFIYEVADQNYEKPIVQRNLPFLSNHLSREEGVIGVYCVLNDDLVPCIRVRFASPCTAGRIWELMTMDTWTITYSADKVKEEPAKMSFKNEGVVRPFAVFE
ncbi:MAG: 4Fe-4S binding protein [Bacteroidales bacterium]|nr:4Fe-4S binding protein [Bacteroidales bacterium]